MNTSKGETYYVSGETRQFEAGNTLEVTSLIDDGSIIVLTNDDGQKTNIPKEYVQEYIKDGVFQTTKQNS